MASTQADSVLVQGAYAAAGGGIPGRGLAMSAALSKVGQQLGDQVAGIIGERYKRFEKFADWELARVQPLNDTEYNELHDDLKRRRNAYVYGGKKDREMLMRELAEERAQSEKLYNAKQKLANAGQGNQNAGEDGLNEDWMGSEQAESLMMAMLGAPVWQGDTKGWMMKCDEGEECENGVKFIDADGVEKLVQEQSYDSSSADLLSSYVEDISNKFQESKVDDSIEFNYVDEYRKIRSEFIDKGNVRSLMSDEIIPGRRFDRDLMGSLMDASYRDLGITDSMLSDVASIYPGVKLDNGISPDEAAIIANEVFKNKNLTKHYLSMYYTNYLRNNWPIQPGKNISTNNQYNSNA